MQGPPTPRKWVAETGLPGGGEEGGGGGRGTSDLYWPMNVTKCDSYGSN